MLNVSSFHPRRRAGAGFTLIETMVTVAIAGVLSSIALPSFESQMQRARRAEVLVSMVQIQTLEERYRSKATGYGSLAKIGMAATSPSGQYGLQVMSPDPDGYEVLATAIGLQTRDTKCAYMRFSALGLNAAYASGPDIHTANPADANRRCWGS